MCSSVQSMIVERCIISDVQIAELLYQYHTLGFDTITQEELQVNVIHTILEKLSLVLIHDHLPGEMLLII